ncbi:MAG: MBL fold metallo-hydrolase [Candidatus Dormibacteraeota bacterium]|nr:MBL fold metallo-hydrolase [Candidatus Dormibacteraeota bacterium]
MHVRVLGCVGGWPVAGRACSGYLVSEGETRVWIDAGAGTLAELLKHDSLGNMGALWISHLHPDHCSDLGLVRNLLAYGHARGGRPLPVYGPPGWGAWFNHAVPDSQATLAAFDMRELKDRARVRTDDIRLTAFVVNHGLVTFACRAESDHGVLAYSADSGPCQALVELAREADLFACEAFLSSPAAGRSETVMTPEQAGEVAAAAEVRSLLLTHLHPDADPAAAAARARTRYAGPVAVAAQGMAYVVASPPS